MRNKFLLIKVDKRKLLIIVSSAAAAALILTLIFYPKTTAEREKTDSVTGIPMVYDYIPEGSGGRPGKARRVKFIVIHETANHSPTADAKGHSEYLKAGGDGSTSWHYTVDDKVIYHHLPDREVAWHAGDKLKSPGGNLNGIGIELCVNNGGDFEKTFDNGARLTAFLLNEYGLSIKSVKQHYDFNGKNCPMTIRETGRWKEFLRLTEKYLDEIKNTPVSVIADAGAFRLV